MSTTDDDGRRRDGQEPQGPFTFDRHLVLEQLGGWRGMVDARCRPSPSSSPTRRRAAGGHLGAPWARRSWSSSSGWSAGRASSRRSAGCSPSASRWRIAAASGQARDYFGFGIVRNAAIAVVLLGSIPLRRPLVGVIAEFLAPSHLGRHGARTRCRACAAAATAPGPRDHGVRPAGRPSAGPTRSPSGPGGRTGGCCAPTAG